MIKSNFVVFILVIVVVLSIHPKIQISNSNETTMDNKSIATDGWHTLSNTLGYHDYFETISFLTNIYELYPEITFYNTSIGLSLEGKNIPALKISDNPDIDELEPEILYFAQMHAREVIALENCLGLIQYICEWYGTDPEITFLVENREIWFIPVVNPDGAQYCADYDYSWRKNRRNNGDGTFGVDLNRNFGFEWGSDSGSSGNPADEDYRGTAPFSEPESQALRDFILVHNFSVSMSMHSYTGLWMWPWAYTAEPTPDETLFSFIGNQLSTFQRYYEYDPISGDELYPVSGDSEDWSYAVKGTFAFSVEIYQGGYGNTFWNFNPPDYSIEYEVINNLDSFLYLAEIAENPENVIYRPMSKIIGPIEGKTVSGLAEVIILTIMFGELQEAYFQVDHSEWERITDNIVFEEGECRFQWPSGALEPGEHTIQAKFIDEFGNSGKSPKVAVNVASISDNTIPEISSPFDMLYNQYDQECYLTWNISDNYPYFANIYLNSSLSFENLQYTNNTVVTIPIDTSIGGIWNYTIVVFDQGGNSVKDTVFITINQTYVSSMTSSLTFTISKQNYLSNTNEKEETPGFEIILMSILLIFYNVVRFYLKKVK